MAGETTRLDLEPGRRPPRRERPLGLGTTVRSAGATLLLAAALAACGHTKPAFTRHGSEESFTLEDLRGKVVVLAFWATWCSPCVGELAALAEIARAVPQDVRLVAVVDPMERGGRRQVQRWLQVNPPEMAPYVAYGNHSLHALFPHDAIPLTVVLDGRGEVVETLDGYSGAARLRAAVKSALERSAAAAR